MKNQYFGDINDYRKYGLLRALRSEGDGSLLVAWMLTPEDGGRDEGLRSYLDDPDTWAKYDPELFKGQADLLSTAPQPLVDWRTHLEANRLCRWLPHLVWCCTDHTSS